MGKQNEHNDSALGKVFGIVGVLAALATGGAQKMEGGAIFFLVLFLGAIGYAVGRWVELLIIKIIFVAAAIIMLLMNIAIRRFVWGLLTAALGD